MSSCAPSQLSVFQCIETMPYRFIKTHFPHFDRKKLMTPTRFFLLIPVLACQVFAAITAHANDKLDNLDKLDRIKQFAADKFMPHGLTQSGLRGETLGHSALQSTQSRSLSQKNPSSEAAAASDQRVSGLIIRFASAEIKALSRDNRPPPPAIVNEVIRSAGVPLQYGRPMSMGAYVFNFPATLSQTETQTVIDRLLRVQSIEKIFPDAEQTQQLTPNDPYANTQYNLMNPTISGYGGGINAGSAWDITQGSSRVVVAVVDSGVQPHPE